jgi:hypothetical protein
VKKADADPEHYLMKAEVGRCVSTLDELRRARPKVGELLRQLFPSEWRDIAPDVTVLDVVERAR